MSTDQWFTSFLYSLLLPAHSSLVKNQTLILEFSICHWVWKPKNHAISWVILSTGLHHPPYWQLRKSGRIEIAALPECYGDEPANFRWTVSCPRNQQWMWGKHGEWQRNVSKRPPCRRTRDWGWLRPWPQRIEDRQQKSLHCERPWQQRRHLQRQTKMRPSHPAWAATRTVRISNQVPYKALGKDDLSVVAPIPGQSLYKSRQWFQKAH